MARVGDDKIVGINCTIWNIKMAGRDDGTVCVSADGVLLRSHYNDGKNETTEATGVDYAPQSPSLFEVPAGFEKMDMPVMPSGMKMPGGMNMPTMPTDTDGQ